MLPNADEQRHPSAEVPEKPLAEDTNTPATALESDGTSVTRRSRRQNPAVSDPNIDKLSLRPPAVKDQSATTAPRPVGRKSRPLRSLVVLSMVGGLVATVALPAYGAWQPAEDTATLQQVAAEDAQSLVVGSDSMSADLARGSYSATTAEEIKAKKDEEAAAAAAAEAAAARARLTTSAASTVSGNINMVSPGSGEVRWPILTYTFGRGLWDSGYHQGVDLLAPAMTPLYATAAGVVSVSQESYGGYGVAISIDHVIGGQQVNSLYAHMTYGSRQVQVGQYVEAGQLIGFVGSTGSSTANHVHFEIHINGGVVDPYAWLQTNAG
ncbi:M23 family metallopeptidase [Microbacterium aurantiacum]|uniref:M23 family metallopeptidase n=1 Tax=Microbacterium aurantiacum TaxID=162393 RepID=UPI004036F15C